jgi:antitoxin MazE
LARATEVVMQVSKWGNSLAVRLPRALVERLGLRPGDALEVVAAEEGRIVVEKQRARGWTVPEGYRFDRDEANAR